MKYSLVLLSLVLISAVQTFPPIKVYSTERPYWLDDPWYGKMVCRKWRVGL
jgi:hypothetical protein